MGDPQDTSTPAWQRPHADDSQPQLDLARRFLDDPDVKAASRDSKVAFLKSKGISNDHVQKLLVNEPPHAAETPTGKTTTSSDMQTSQTPSASSSHSSSVVDSSARPPVVTYPEFLAKPQRPPPLVTSSAIISTLYALVGLSTLLYGTSKYAIGPMVEALTDARTHLYATTSEKLRLIVSKLESTVSVLPLTQQPVVTSDHDSDDDDPYEMFHRDVGTQTCAFAANSATQSMLPDNQAAYMRQGDRLATATKTLSSLKDQLRAQSEGLEDTRSLLDVFRDELDGMTYSGQTHIVSGFNLYGAPSKSEPDDEIRKVRDSIRRVKGVLLSTRNFPTSTTIR
ncbi:hypothetical protein CDD82_3351 [Ophiocordyceps australis]|uniref:Peroxisomal membrane protein PEX14 n=1 Tax=Ophiocordyceps australis TaxID=1399860 RepID=A0A2C5Z9X7_9HYPO|nr:hypothetical protein CDD82_3351 [Ophiocordyceps australis]